MRALQRCNSPPLKTLIFRTIFVYDSFNLASLFVCLFVCCCLRVFWRAVCFVATEEPDLIGDFTRPFALPLTAGKHQDLKCITPQTLVDLMNGKFKNHVENFTIVDCRYPSFSQINQQQKKNSNETIIVYSFCKCIDIICKLIWIHFFFKFRYPYEYNYGHIIGAHNLWTKDMVWNMFMDGKRAISPSSTSVESNSGEGAKRNILIFHCEFSSERGPALWVSFTFHVFFFFSLSLSLSLSLFLCFVLFFMLHFMAVEFFPQPSSRTTTTKKKTKKKTSTVI